MPNRRRGEVVVTFGGERYTLCLTLAALAELEDAFGVADLAALRGGGRALSDAEVAALPLDGGIEAVAAALADCLTLAFGGVGPENPPRPQGA